jgi:hypothetical protein
MLGLWHLRGSVPLDTTAGDEAVLDGLESLLDRQWKLISERGPTHIEFDAGFFGHGWSAMVAYDRGRFWIEEGRGGRTLRYDLRSLYGFLFCRFAAAVVFLIALAGEAIVAAAMVAALAFGWLYGMNIIQAVIRVPPLIRRAARSD